MSAEIFTQHTKPLFSLYHFHGRLSKRQIMTCVILTLKKKQKKTGLTFHANCLLRRQFAWNVKPIFWKNMAICCLLKNLTSVLSISALFGEMQIWWLLRQVTVCVTYCVGDFLWCLLIYLITHSGKCHKAIEHHFIIILSIIKLAQASLW